MDVKVKKINKNFTLIHQSVPGNPVISSALQFGRGLTADSDDLVGSSLIYAEMCSRHAGGKSAREFARRFVANGISHSESVGHKAFLFRSTCLPERLDVAQKIMHEMYASTDLYEDSLAKIKESLQIIALGIEDEPMRKVGKEFNQRYYQPPFNRALTGDVAGISKCEISDLKAIQNSALDTHVYLSMVSGLEHEQAAEQVIKNFALSVSDDPGEEAEQESEAERAKEFSEHLDYPSNQIQILLAFDAPPIGSEDYYRVKVLNGILSGGMFGRLFLEVREKRGLCYSVYSSYQPKKKIGRMICYAGTTTERAAETLQVIKDVFANVANDLSAEELERVKTDILSSLVIGRETSGAKCSTNLADYRNYQRIRSLDEIKKAITDVSVDDLQSYIQQQPFNDYSILTLGNKAIF